MKPFGLRVKILAFLVLPGAAVLLTTLFLIFVIISKETEQQIRDEAKILAKTFVAYTTSPTHLAPPHMQRIIDELSTEKYPHFRKISFFLPAENDNYTIAASSSREDLLNKRRLNVITPPQEKIIEEPQSGEKLFLYSTPIFWRKKTIAFIEIQMDLSKNSPIVFSLIKRIFLISAAGSLLLLTIFYLSLKKLLLHPLNILTNATQEIRSGGDIAPLKIERKDEIGLLAQHFNEMISALSQREKENLLLHEKLNQSLKRAEEEAMTDGLTGLRNHRYFQDCLEKEIMRVQRSSKPLSIAFCDLDFFKSFNDVNGHLLGDEALKQVAKIIQETLREIDVAARYGGEEFALMLPETDKTGARAVAERIRNKVASLPFTQKATTHLTISIGIASYPEDALTKRELLDRADSAMYFAKQKGRNQVRCFTLEKEIEQKLAVGFSRQELHLSSLTAMAKAVDVKDYGKPHSEEVSALVKSTATALFLGEKEVRNLTLAALLHDLGKIVLEEKLLKKRGKISAEEWQKLSAHPQIAWEILKATQSFEALLEPILYHHERFDGKGYPKGLRRAEIPLGARILCLCDSYHAMISHRPYRRAFSREEVVEEIKRCSGRQFDPAIVEVFLKILPQLDRIKDNFSALNQATSWVKNAASQED